MGFEGFPFVVGWELTLACNIRCRHCASSAGRPRADELTLEEALALCDQFPALLVKEVDFTGGEPLMYPGWPKVAARLAALGITTRILTNGFLLEPDTVAQIKDVGVVSVGVSLDGIGATHDHIRGREGLFRSALEGIERVLNAGLKVTVITTVNGMNIGELAALRDQLQSVGVGSWQMQPILPLGRSHEAAELALSEQQYIELGTFFQESKPKAQEAGLMMLPADSLGYFSELDAFELSWRGCPAGQVSCGITSDGKVKGCLSLPDELIEGDLRQDDLWAIWFREDSFAYTRQFSEDKMGDACRGCDMAEQCMGGCTAMSVGYTGRFHNDPYCFYGITNRSECGSR